MSEELLPCPFCGSANLEEDWSAVREGLRTWSQTGWIECLVCEGEMTLQLHSESEAEGAADKLHKKWNRRTKTAKEDI